MVKRTDLNTEPRRPKNDAIHTTQACKQRPGKLKSWDVGLVLSAGIGAAAAWAYDSVPLDWMLSFVARYGVETFRRTVPAVWLGILVYCATLAAIALVLMFRSRCALRLPTGLQLLTVVIALLTSAWTLYRLNDWYLGD